MAKTKTAVKSKKRAAPKAKPKARAKATATPAAKELAAIRKFAAGLDADPHSDDPAEVAKAEQQLAEVSDRLRAWARKYNVKLTEHTESHVMQARTARRRRCAATLPDVPVGGKHMMCFLIGKQGRNCLYNCLDRDATYDPF